MVKSELFVVSLLVLMASMVEASYEDDDWYSKKAKKGMKGKKGKKMGKKGKKGGMKYKGKGKGKGATLSPIPSPTSAPDDYYGDIDQDEEIEDEQNQEAIANCADPSNVPIYNPPDIETVFDQMANTCADMNPNFPNVDCIHVPGPQAGANVTMGYQGGMEVDYEPNLNTYFSSSMCPVNVHWHKGTEHYSMGEYDEDGDGPNGNLNDYFQRKLAGDEVRAGFRCHYYDAEDPKFTTEYEWKHCIGMEVGETYEVHWPHSTAGACGSINQYQTPFYDGVFCNLPLDVFQTLSPQDIAYNVGVQAQIYTVVNDEAYFYPDLMRGWITDAPFAQDVAYYTGSTTGTTRSNEICSQYTPITWQVDRKCHMISASTFDNLCYQMKLQHDDMSYDLEAHGSRELVSYELTSNNFHRKRERKLHQDDHHHDHEAHDHDHHHDHEAHDHDHDSHDHHHHHKWF